MEITVKNIVLGSPNVKVNTDIKVIDRPAPEFKTISAAAVILIPFGTVFGTLENATIVEEGE